VENLEKTALLTITDNAGRAFGGFDWSAHEGKGVRLFVQGMGCSGPSVGMALDEATAEDEVVEQTGVRFMIDPQTQEILRQGGGLTVDFIDEEERRGYLLTLGKPGDCKTGGCCGCG
jgi:iron-sulfur cluster assembly accessory protein